MEKSEILLVLKKHIVAAIDGVKEADIDPQKSMEVLGASSMDIVSIVSSCMRELKIKIPRTKLKDMKSIDMLADLFFESQATA